MKIRSTAFKHEGTIPTEYSCDGKDINPELHIEDVPNNTKSLALIVDDPDAPVGLFVHWVVWNIDPTTTGIEQNSVPKGAQQGTTDFQKNEWGGPCPPDREHRYFFKLYALDTTLDLPQSTTAKELEAAMEGHILKQAELMGRYDRTKRTQANQS